MCRQTHLLFAKCILNCLSFFPIPFDCIGFIHSNKWTNECSVGWNSKMLNVMPYIQLANTISESESHHHWQHQWHQWLSPSSGTVHRWQWWPRDQDQDWDTGSRPGQDDRRWDCHFGVCCHWTSSTSRQVYLVSASKIWKKASCEFL